ncbi:MAG: SDR family oxidoreductase [Acidimicrobiales bacterium]
MSSAPRAGHEADAVIVTGSSSGLGLETALHLAERGFNVFATVRDIESAPAVLKAAKERGVTLQVRQLDLGDRDGITAAVDKMAAEAGGLFGLVNNGGLGLRGCLEDTTDEEIRRVFEANVFGTMAVTKAVLPHLRRGGRGRIITITSIGGRISSFGVSVYCSTKFAQEGMAEGLALEVAPFGIQAVIIEPGIIKTSRWSVNRGTAVGAHDPASPYHGMFEASETVADKLVNRSKTTSEDVARAVHEALTAAKPRLRYVVGRPASVVLRMRRLLPDPWFEKMYWGPFVRQITRKGRPRTAAQAGR